MRQIQQVSKPFLEIQKPLKDKVKHNKIFQMLTNFIENCTSVMITLSLAELSRRIYKFFYEYCYFGKRYPPDQRFQQILKRTFSLTPIAQFTSICLILGIVLQFGLTKRFPLVSTQFLLYMPLYWIFHGTQLSKSNLDYVEWIRAPIGMDYGEGMASSFFHGYINLTMPSFTGELGIRERIELFEANKNVKFAVNRLIILIPSEMYIDAKIVSPLLEKVQGLETVIKNRAGVLRPYQSDVYRFTKRINDKNYYIALEGATPLLTFYEAVRSNVTATWQMKEFQRDILFKFYKSLKRIIDESPETRNEVELIFYNAKKADGSQQDIGEILWNRLENHWLREHHPHND